MIELLAIAAVRKTVEALFLVAALAAIIYSIYHAGMQAGQRAESSAEVEASHAEFTRVENGFKQQLDAASATVEQYHSLAATLLQNAQQSADNAKRAIAEGAAAKEKLDAVQDSQLQQDLEAKLGGPLLRPDILRADDVIVTDYPHKVQQAQDLSNQVSALDQAAAAQTKQLEAVGQQRDAAITAHNKLLPLYKQAYDAGIEGHRKWYCLWICKPKKKLSLPDPGTLPLQPASTSPKT